MTLPKELPFDLSFLYQMTPPELLLWAGTALLVAILLTWLFTFLWMRRRQKRALLARDLAWKERLEQLRGQLLAQAASQEEEHRRRLEALLEATSRRLSKFREQLAELLAEQVTTARSQAETVLELAGARMAGLNEAWCERLFQHERRRAKAYAELVAEQLALFESRLEALAEVAGIVRTTPKPEPKEEEREELPAAEALAELNRLWEERLLSLANLLPKETSPREERVAAEEVLEEEEEALVEEETSGRSFWERLFGRRKAPSYSSEASRASGRGRSTSST